MNDSEIRHNGRGHGLFVVYVLAIVFFFYFGFFGLIMLDEGVFRTFWFSRTMNQLAPLTNQSISETVRTIYAPLIWIVKHLGALR
jgi:hypothetical protein